MTRIYTTTLVIGMALLTACARMPDERPVPASNVAGRLDTVLEAYAKNNRFSGTAVLAVDGKVVLEQSYGSTNVELRNRPMTPATPMNIGSIGKMFTHAMVLERVETGNWQLETTVEELWPESGIPNADRISIRHLLSHTSGLGNYFQHPDYTLEQRELEDFIELVRTQELAFETPGEDTFYSNSAFWVLAALLERHDPAGRDWATMTADEVFARAGMKDIRWYQPDEEYADRPRGYLINPIGERKDMTHDDARPGPDGGLYMPARDLYRFTEAVRADEWYSRSMLETARQVTGPFIIEGCDFAMTWEICSVDGIEITGKGGTTSGGGSEMLMFRHNGHDYTLVMLSNVSNSPLEIHRNTIRYMFDLPQAELPRTRASIVVHEAMLSGELPLEGEPFRKWMKENDVEHDPLGIVLLALHYSRNGKMDEARAVLRMNLSIFPDHDLSRRVLDRLQGA